MSNKIYKSELFWLNHPNDYVYLYMKHDWFQMDRINFMASYIKKLFESKLEEKKEAIMEVIAPIWNDMPTSEKYIVLSKFSEGKYDSIVFFQMEKLNEIFKCEFLANTIDSVYHKVTGMNYDTNFFTCYGINSAK